MSGTILEACCGAGGEAEGFRKHFEITHAFDIKPEAVSTYAANHRGTDVRRQDIRFLTGCRGDYDGITGVIGGPPCQGSSIINTQRNKPDERNTLLREYREEDPRNYLMGEFMRLVTEIRPQFFMMENVPGVTKERKNSVIRTGRMAGYSVTSVYLNAAEYGAAQTRKRWFVVGPRGRQWAPPEKRPASTVRKAFSGIRNNWGLMQSRPDTLERLTHAIPGEWTGITGNFRSMIRLQWDQPSPAVVNLKKVYMVHPGECRNISLAEAASLQGFPPGYIWNGTESQVSQMIANAMPSEMAESIAGSIVL